jgi:hypothetical protein
MPDSLGDLDSLLLGDGQARDAPPRVDVEPDPFEQFSRAPLLGAAHDQAHPAVLPAERQVLGHGEMRRKRELLMHHRDPEPLRVPRIAEPDLLARDQDGSLAWLLNLREQLHQRRLAGAVLPRDRVHLSGEDVEADAVEGLHPGEALAHAADLDHRLTLVAHGKLLGKPPSGNLPLFPQTRSQTSQRESGRDVQEGLAACIAVTRIR